MTSMPRTTTRTRLLAATALLTGGTQALAHHSTSQYNLKESRAIAGTVVKYEWANPHVYLWIESPSKGGATETWEIESGPPYTLKRLGWTRDSLRPGEHVKVTGHPGKDAARDIMLMVSLEKADHTVLTPDLGGLGKYFDFIATQDAASKATASGLDGTWDTLLTLKFAGWFYSPAQFPLTEAGREAVANDHVTDDSASVNCVPESAPAIMVAPTLKRIRVRGQSVIISSETAEDARVIHLDATTHDGAVPSLQGHSIGHWEGSTLMIDTARFSPRNSRLPSSPQRHLTERLTLDKDGARLNYSFVLEDPVYLAKPITGELQWSYRPDLDFTPVPCALDSARRYREP